MEAPSNNAAREDLRAGKSNLLHLPILVVTDILSRLPIKTVVAAKCVCKSWLNLVSGDTHLAKLHRQRSPTTELLLRSAAHSPTLYFGNLQFYNDRVTVHNVKLSPLFDLPGFYITSNNTIILLGEMKRNDLSTIRSEKMKKKRNCPVFAHSCNGLVCFDSRSDSRYESRDAVIANPVTGEFVTVPISTKWSKEINPTVNHRLGFCEKENRFKLLRATYRADSSEQFAEIFTFEKGSKWREIGECPHPILHSARSESVILGHMLLYGFVSSGTVDDGIACFDFETERFGVVPIPTQHCQALKHDSVFGVFRGCLFLSWLPRMATCNEIWVMKEYGVEDSWEKMFSIPFGLENGAEDSWGVKMVSIPFGCHVPLKQLENGEILMLCKQKCLVLHNPSQNRTRVLRYGIKFSEVSAYIPTLLRLEDALAGYEACIHNVNSRRGCEEHDRDVSTPDGNEGQEVEQEAQKT